MQGIVLLILLKLRAWLIFNRFYGYCEDNHTKSATGGNTMILYIRMVDVGVLLTGRFILQVFGVTDYGVYNVVGG